MCTLVLLWRPGHAWPLLIAANRDERLDRAWDPPASHWPDRPGIVGGRDRTAGGTWMAASTRGMTAAVLNRSGSLGPAPGKRSRGDLPLMALAHSSAGAAARALAGLDAGEWRSFNLVVADRDACLFLRGRGEGRMDVEPFRPGTHMVTAKDPDDPDSPRVARHLPRFRAASPPDPARGDWSAWRTILADRSPGAVGSELNVPPAGGFGTVCASLLGVPATGRPVWLFAPGPPDAAEFLPVLIP